MKDLLRSADEIPVTLLLALGIVTLALLTHPFDPTAEQLDHYGWLTPLQVANGESWRLLSSTLLHGGLLHLFCNLSALAALGPALERSLGSLRFLALWLASALGGSVAVCLAYEVDGSVVGASGGIFGLLGALVALNMRAGRHLFSFLDHSGPRQLLWTIAMQFVIGWLLPMVSNTAHLGGLLGGFWVTFLWLAPGREVTSRVWHWRIATTTLFGSLLFASIVPPVRFDVLWNRSVAATAADRREALQRAAVRAFYELDHASPADIERFVTEELQPRRR